MYEKTQLLRMYEKMMKIRKFEEKAEAFRLSGKIMGNAHVYIGEEAIATGVCEALKKDDYIESTHRGHGHTIAKGGELKYMMAELFGKKTGYCHGNGGSMHIADFSIGMLGANGIVGGGYSMAVGAALSARIRKTDQISVVFFGDGASNRGTFHEAANMASAWRLPVIFVCENNGWAASTPFDGSQNSIQDIALRAIGYNIPSKVVNGNDIFEVYEAAKEFVDDARAGVGRRCAFLECKTYRIKGHIIGDAQTYRDPEAALHRLYANDPIDNFKRRVLVEGWVNQAELDEIDERVSKAIDEAVKFAEESPYPEKSDLFADLYV
ncbi:MAG: thiamine pyrophosphate-dependent dehydrogenase E1 component subunit alpha [Lachnospiraceae bacterium]|nr:thiamine pyrophosphate-dependent dehydrogenase E1 component subunit alpha [Lachnospiraceae bacterium]